jgi:hypothetical protein
MSGVDVPVTVHRFAPVAEGPQVVVLVGRDADGPFAALLAVDRRYREIPQTPGAVVELAALAHQLAAAAILACADAPDQLAAVAGIKLTIAAGSRWRIERGGGLPAVVGDQIAMVRASSVDQLQRAAGWLTDRAVAALELAVRS